MMLLEPLLIYEIGVNIIQDLPTYVNNMLDYVLTRELNKIKYYYNQFDSSVH